MNLSLMLLGRLTIGTILLMFLGDRAALSKEFKLDQLSNPIKLAAIPRSDNGKLVGMAASFGNSFLRYKAFRGQMNLKYVGKFDENKLPSSKRTRYSFGMAGAAIYQVKDADQFLTKNSRRLFLGSGVKPTFITMQEGRYVDGQKVIWACILSSASIEQYYESQIGHERCDAFQYSEVTHDTKGLFNNDE